MALYPFPDVPIADGVPPLPRIPAVVNESSIIAQSLAANVAILLAGENEPQWGVYDQFGQLIGQTLDGTFAGVSDAGPLTLSFDYRKGTIVSDFPVEQGSFAAYNKVELPGNPIVTLVVTGTIEQREAFLAAIDYACWSTDLYNVVTPEVTYINHSIESYAYSRSNNRGANVIVVELTLKEIRTVSAAYTTAATTAPVQSPQDSGATPQTNSGKVQPATPPQSTLKAIYNKLGLGG